MAATEELRNDVLWRRKTLGSRPAKSLRFADHGGFARLPRFRDLRDKVLSMGPEVARAVFTDAVGSRGRGASLGDSYIQGSGPKVAMREGINWKDLWALKEALSKWRTQVRRKLVLARMGNAAAVAYANHGAGRSSQLTRLAREIKEQEIVAECTAAAPHIAGKGNASAGALPRFSIKASGGDPFPDGELRPKFRATATDHCGRMGVNVMTDDKGPNARCDRSRSPSRSAFEGPSPPGQFWWFPRVDLIHMALGRIHRSIREAWFGVHVCFLLVQPWKRWFSKLYGLSIVLARTADSELFVDRSAGLPRRAPTKGMRTGW